MATRFELVLHGDDPVRLRAAGEEALEEIRRVEAQLSFYKADSEIIRINACAARAAVRVEPRLFRLLERCAALSAATEGAFDITVGPLMRVWRFVGDGGGVPATSLLEAARAQTGIHHVEFNESDFTVRFSRPGVEIDLGGYGKGYAIERAIDLLRENGARSALLHGGTSSVAAIGTPPCGDGWKVELSDPLKGGDQPAIISLADNALSVSAAHGKSFTVDGRTYGHIIDPRSGEPVSVAQAAAVRGPSAADCEALSKALLVLGPAWLTTMAERFPGYGGVVAFENATSQIEIARSDSPEVIPASPAAAL